MKKLLILPVILLILRLIPCFGAECAETGSYTYTVIGEEVTVTGFTGEPVILDIPPYIENLPVTSVRDNAFYCCDSLRCISLPATVKTMGHHCFYGCSSLDKVTLPARLETMGMGCFEGCSSLTGVILPDTLRALPDSCFRMCTGLTGIMIPQSVNEIEKFCFCGCTSLSYVSLSGELTAVGIGAFYQCDKLDMMYIPPSVKNIGTEALGFTTGGIRTGLSLIGAEDSAAEDYAGKNGISFSASPEAVQAFDPAESKNAPVKLPPALAASGGLLFLLTALIALRQYIKEYRDRTKTR